MKTLFEVWVRELDFQYRTAEYYKSKDKAIARAKQLAKNYNCGSLENAGLDTDRIHLWAQDSKTYWVGVDEWLFND